MVEKIVKYGLEDFRIVKLYNVKVGLQRRMLLRRHKICRDPLTRYIPLVVYDCQSGPGCSKVD